MFTHILFLIPRPSTLVLNYCQQSIGHGGDMDLPEQLLVLEQFPLLTSVSHQFCCSSFSLWFPTVNDICLYILYRVHIITFAGQSNSCGCSLFSAMNEDDYITFYIIKKVMNIYSIRLNYKLTISLIVFDKDDEHLKLYIPQFNDYHMCAAVQMVISVISFN